MEFHAVIVCNFKIEMLSSGKVFDAAELCNKGSDVKFCILFISEGIAGEDGTVRNLGKPSECLRIIDKIYRTGNAFAFQDGSQRLRDGQDDRFEHCF